MTSRFKASKKKSRVRSRLNNAKLSSSSHVMSVEGDKFCVVWVVG